MLTIEVKRRRISLVQGEADIYVNSQFVMTFGDTIQLISPGKKYYGERIGNWASVIPDSAFIKGLFYHPYDLVYHYSDKAKEPIFLTAAPKEEVATHAVL